MLEVGSRVIYRGEFGVIKQARDDPDGAWWVIELNNGEITSALDGDPYLAPLNCQNFVRAVLNSVAARHLPVDRAVALIELVLS